MASASARERERDAKTREEKSKIHTKLAKSREKAHDTQNIREGTGQATREDLGLSMELNLSFSFDSTRRSGCVLDRRRVRVVYVCGDCLCYVVGPPRRHVSL